MAYTNEILLKERDYKFSVLKKKIDKFKGRKLAIYGAGVNAREMIAILKDCNVICLIDEKNTGKYLYGKKVLSIEDAARFGVDVVFIAAELAAEMIVRERINEFCYDNHISLCNMCGIDYQDIWLENMNMDIRYNELTLDSIMKTVDDVSTICVELEGGLYESVFYTKEDFWETLESENHIEGFAQYRSIAERKYDHRMAFSIDRIYDNYMTDSYCTHEDIKRLKEIEENAFEENVILKKEMSDVIKYASNEGKKIAVVSMLPYSERMIRKLISNAIGDADYILVKENVWEKTFGRGILREAIGSDIGQATAYFGGIDTVGFYLAKCYEFTRVLIKNSMEAMNASCEYSFNIANMDLRKRRAFKTWCVNEYNSPFIGDIKEGKIEKWLDDIQCEPEKLDIYPLIHGNSASEYDKLEFNSVESPKVSIIIPVYNHFPDTYRCLEAILKNTFNVEYEVLIADDASTDVTMEIERIVSGICLVRNKENLMFLKNCNNAAQYAKGEYLVFLNNDTQVRMNWLLPLVDILERDETVGLVGSKLIGADGLIQEAGAIVFADGSAMNYGRGKSIFDRNYNYVRDVDYISGAAIMIRSDLWKQIGGFDERYAPAYCEDSDLAFEVRKKGFRVVYQPASEVIHFEGVSNGTDLKSGVKKNQTINSRKLSQKWNDVLRDQYENIEELYLSACERKGKKKTILVVSTQIPTYDKDAGSKSIYMYLKLFLRKGYIVKFWPINEYPMQPYTYELQQMGIQVLCNQDKQKTRGWIVKHAKQIDYAFINYPIVANEIMDFLSILNIRVRYYGHDLHYLRLKRGYELTGDEPLMDESDRFYKIEKDIIEKADHVYYPSEMEVDRVKKVFGKKEVSQIALYCYDRFDETKYDPIERRGIMFIGGNHPPNADAVKWFLKDIYPLICARKEMPFYLIGANKLEDNKELLNSNVICTGYVSEEELLDIYHKIKMVVIPLRYGAGIKGKLVDALYYGVPIVTTSIGAEGVDEDGEAICVENDANKFADAVCELYEDDDRLVQMSLKERKLMDREFSAEKAWRKIAKEFA